MNNQQLTTCTACGATCDDIRLERGEAGKVARADNACAIGEQFFQLPLSAGCEATVNGKAASLADAVERAGEILAAARMPLVAGLQYASSEAIRAAVEVADFSGACIDWTTSPADAASTLALQTAGGVTATLGEVAQRADVLLLWASDLAETHPRHFQRYSLLPTSPWLPAGRDDRTLIVIDDGKTETAAQADVAITIAPGSDYEALTVVRSLVAGLQLDGERVLAQTGVDLPVWNELVERMKQAKFGAAIYGKRLALAGPEPLVELTQLMADLTAITRWVALGEGGPGNATGAANVLTWQTGAPLAVNFANGGPSYSPREWNVARLVERGEVDAVLIVSADLPQAWNYRLADIPTVAIDWRDTATMRQADVSIRTARPGVECDGTTYRVDGIALPMRGMMESNYPATEAVLKQICRRFAVSTVAT